MAAERCRVLLTNGQTSLQLAMLKGTGPISLPISLQTAPTPTNGCRNLHRTWMHALLLLKQVGIAAMVFCHCPHGQALCRTDKTSSVMFACIIHAKGQSIH